jgi:hypothetical protein
MGLIIPILVLLSLVFTVTAPELVLQPSTALVIQPSWVCCVTPVTNLPVEKFSLFLATNQQHPFFFFWDSNLRGP